MPKRKKISLASEDSKDGSECSKQRKFLDPVSRILCLVFLVYVFHIINEFFYYSLLKESL